METTLNSDVMIAMITSAASMFAATIAAIVSIVNTRITSRNTKHIGEVKEQVQNSHGTNLRNDIDSIIASNTSIHDRITNISNRMDDREEQHIREHGRMWSAITGRRDRRKQ